MGHSLLSRCYRLVTPPATQTAARDNCRTQGGTLAAADTIFFTNVTHMLLDRMALLRGFGQCRGGRGDGVGSSSSRWSNSLFLGLPNGRATDIMYNNNYFISISLFHVEVEVARATAGLIIVTTEVLV